MSHLFATEAQENDIGSFSINLRQEYPDISRQAIHILLPFAKTYLCELPFSSLALIMHKQSSGLESVGAGTAGTFVRHAIPCHENL